MYIKQKVQLTPNCFLHEIVDPVTYFTIPDHGEFLVDMKVVECFQLLRSFHGKSIKINDWFKHLPEDDEMDDFDPVKFLKHCEAIGCPVWSGLRTDLSKVGGKGSQHRVQKDGKFHALDPKGDTMTYFDIVRANAEAFYEVGLRRLENPSITKNWQHQDTSEVNHKKGHIRVVNQKDHAFDIRVSDRNIVNITNLNGFVIK